MDSGERDELSNGHTVRELPSEINHQKVASKLKKRERMAQEAVKVLSGRRDEIHSFVCIPCNATYNCFTIK